MRAQGTVGVAPALNADVKGAVSFSSTLASGHDASGTMRHVALRSLAFQHEAGDCALTRAGAFFLNLTGRRECCEEVVFRGSAL